MKLLFFFLLPLSIHAQPKTLKYEWRKISGPSQYKIVSPHSSTTQFTNLVEGVYQFELKVTNKYGLSARDTMKVTVNPAVNGKNSAKGKSKKLSN